MRVGRSPVTITDNFYWSLVVSVALHYPVINISEYIYDVPSYQTNGIKSIYIYTCSTLRLHYIYIVLLLWRNSIRLLIFHRRHWCWCFLHSFASNRCSSFSFYWIILFFTRETRHIHPVCTKVDISKFHMEFLELDNSNPPSPFPPKHTNQQQHKQKNKQYTQTPSYNICSWQKQLKWQTHLEKMQNLLIVRTRHRRLEQPCFLVVLCLKIYI